MSEASRIRVTVERWSVRAAITGAWFCLLLSLACAQSPTPSLLDPGVAALLHHNYDLAITCFTENIHRNPSDPYNYLNRGVAYKYKGDFDDALADYNQAIRINPRMAQAYGNRGVLLENKGNLDSALADFNQALQLNPQSANFSGMRGKLYLKKGDYVKALSDFDDALRLNPSLVSAQTGRAEALALENAAPAANPAPVIAPSQEPVPAKPPPLTSISLPSTALPTNAEGFPDAAPPPDLSLPGKLTILGQELALKDQKTSPDKSQFIAEYIPAGSTWDDYTLLFAIRFHRGEYTAPVIKAERLGATILALKPREPLANAAVFKSTDGKSALVDFILSSKDFSLEAHTGYLEHNFWRYTNSNGGMLSYQIARRIYSSKSSGQEILAFMKGITPMRPSLSTEINNPQLPVPKLAQGATP